jgi:hypothetical protein
MSDSPSVGPQSYTRKLLSGRRLALHPTLLAVAAFVCAPSAFSQMELKNAQTMATQSPAVAAAAAAPATPNMNCTLIVPDNPLSAKGLATPYKLFGTDAAANGPCNEANPNQGAFVQAGIIDTDTGQVSIYNPLVIDWGTTAAVPPRRADAAQACHRRPLVWVQWQHPDAAGNDRYYPDEREVRQWNPG